MYKTSWRETKVVFKCCFAVGCNKGTWVEEKQKLYLNHLVYKYNPKNEKVEEKQKLYLNSLVLRSRCV